jgi:hypothetical protein
MSGIPFLSHMWVYNDGPYYLARLQIGREHLGGLYWAAHWRLVWTFIYVCCAFSGSRTTRKVNNICCNNFKKGTCRKVICEKCFNDYGWDWARFTERPSEWICTHCRDCCPSRAQCAIYRRTNERRREHLQRGVRQGTLKPSGTLADRIHVSGLLLDIQVESETGGTDCHRFAKAVQMPQYPSVKPIPSMSSKWKLIPGRNSRIRSATISILFEASSGKRSLD